MSLVIKKYSLGIAELGKQILDYADLDIGPGKIVVLVGENGSGKSSFAMSLLGIPGYERSGSVKIDGKETVGLEIDEIARLGLFVSFQSPPEIEGVTLFDFLNASYRSIYGSGGLSSFKLRKKIIDAVERVGLNVSFLERPINQGFSGGERRKSEVLQMLVLEPKVAVLDEVDSGLDIRSTINVANLLRETASHKKCALLVISHSIEFIRKLHPDKIFQLKNKKFIEVTLEEIESSGLIQESN
ncbi:MAG: ABC transporter ATP-binding protein [Candidatus Dojkabacteria bacterium]|nr:MAG: ABC transporter ATP-binding protein [Candidatus Dojkabacteria bacterium]